VIFISALDEVMDKVRAFEVAASIMSQSLFNLAKYSPALKIN